MHFTPLSEDELDIINLLPEGIYDYKVIKSEEKISKAGNDCIYLQLLIHGSDGNNYLVFTNLALIKLLKHFCDVNNMQDLYKSGNIGAYDCIDKSGGRVVIGIEKEKPNPSGGFYKAKNIVKDYIADAKGSPQMPLAQKAVDDFTNDEIPF